MTWEYNRFVGNNELIKAWREERTKPPPDFHDRFDCQECGLLAEQAKAIMEVLDSNQLEIQRLRRQLAASLAFLIEAKRIWAPTTTNSLVDEWLAQTSAALAAEQT
jgi:hypothetical protein